MKRTLRQIDFWLDRHVIGSTGGYSYQNRICRNQRVKSFGTPHHISGFLPLSENKNHFIPTSGCPSLIRPVLSRRPLNRTGFRTGLPTVIKGLKIPAPKRKQGCFPIENNILDFDFTPSVTLSFESHGRPGSNLDFRLARSGLQKQT